MMSKEQSFLLSSLIVFVMVVMILGVGLFLALAVT